MPFQIDSTSLATKQHTPLLLDNKHVKCTTLYIRYNQRNNGAYLSTVVHAKRALIRCPAAVFLVEPELFYTHSQLEVKHPQ